MDEGIKHKPLSDDLFKVSSYSHPGGIIATCVAVAIHEDGVSVRNSNDPDKKAVNFTHSEWKAFTKGVKSGEFDV